MNNNKFIAYSDGSCDNLNPMRPGGSAYIIMDENENIIKKKSKGFIGTTNNRMELLAVISIVNSLPNNSTVTIHTDSQYCIKAIRARYPKANIDQIRLYHKLCREKNITVYLNWVRGHANNKYNNECDSMANAEYQRMCGEYYFSNTRFKYKDLSIGTKSSKTKTKKPKKKKHEQKTV